MSKSEKSEIVAAPSVALNLQPAIDVAVALGKDGVEVLERLHAIQKDERAAAALAAFNADLATLHARLGSVKKTCTASFRTKDGRNVTYRYADRHAIATAARKAGSGELGFAWSWDHEVLDSSVRVICVLKHRDGHRETSTWTAPIEGGNPLTSACQKAKIATTFAERVTLASVLGMTDTDDDVDGHMPDDAASSVAATTITDEQSLIIDSKIEDSGANLAKFLAWLGAPSINDINAADFPRALAMLNRKVKERRAR